MADDIDVEALLEDSYNKKKNKDSKSNSHSPERSTHRSSRRRSRSSDDSRSRHRRRSRSRSRDNRHRDRDHKYYRRRRSSSDSRRRRHRRRDSRDSKYDGKWTNMVDKVDMVPLSDAERDARTILMMQLQKSVSNRDIEEFFADVGKIRDIRMIADRSSRRSKGIAYVEFQHIESVTLAIKMSGSALNGGPVIIQNTMSEKNRAALELSQMSKAHGFTKLFVGSLNLNITEKMLRAIFEPFGTIESVQLQYDESGRSKGYGNISFKDAESAKQAIEKMDGFELVGKKIKVGLVSDSSDVSNQPTLNTDILDDEETDKGGVGLNATSRAMLMQKLAAARGMTDLISNVPVAPSTETPSPSSNQTPFIVLSNMFDPTKEGSKPEILKEIENDVYKVVSKFAQIVHIHVDKNSKEGNVYLKLKSTKEAAAVVDDMNGRKYAGRVIKAFHVSSVSYHNLFPSVI